MKEAKNLTVSYKIKGKKIPFTFTGNFNKTEANKKANQLLRDYSGFLSYIKISVTCILLVAFIFNAEAKKKHKRKKVYTKCNGTCVAYK